MKIAILGWGSFSCSYNRLKNLKFSPIKDGLEVLVKPINSGERLGESHSLQLAEIRRDISRNNLQLIINGHSNLSVNPEFLLKAVEQANKQ